LYEKLHTIPFLDIDSINDIIMNEDKKEYAIGIDINGTEHKFELDKINGIRCGNKQLISLDLYNCPNLYSLHCWNNYLTILDFTNCPKLKHVRCSNNQLTNLDVTNNLKLVVLVCDENSSLKKINMSNDANLLNLHCDNFLCINEFTKYSNTNIKLYI